MKPSSSPPVPSPLDVLVITQEAPPSRSGLSELLEALCTQLPVGSIRVSCPSRTKASSFGRPLRAELHRAPTGPMGTGRFGMWLWYQHLRWMCRTKLPGLVVVVGTEGAGELALKIREEFDVPFVLHEEGRRFAELRTHQDGTKRRLLSDLVNGTEAILVSTKTCWMEAYKLDIHPHEIEILGTGVDLERFSPRKRTRELTEKWSVGNGPVVVTFVGTNEVDHETVLRAFAAMRSSKRGATLVVVGDVGSAWRDLARQLKVDRGTQFVRDASEETRAELLQLADAVVVSHVLGKVERPSSFVIEAMAAGVPLAGTKSPLLEELVEQDEFATICEPGAHAKLGRALLDVLRSPRAGEYRRRARRAAEREHDLAANVTAYREFLDIVYYRRLAVEDVPVALQRREEPLPESEEQSSSAA